MHLRDAAYRLDIGGPHDQRLVEPAQIVLERSAVSRKRRPAASRRGTCRCGGSPPPSAGWAKSRQAPAAIAAGSQGRSGNSGTISSGHMRRMASRSWGLSSMNTKLSRPRFSSSAMLRILIGLGLPIDAGRDEVVLLQQHARMRTERR